MPITPGDIREQLLASYPEFQKLAQEHTRYETQIEQLSKSSFHNSEELIQEAELKKLRLRVKDEMEQLIARNSRTRSATAG
jgi:uncharacterized protein YdcH (DUF465 family)